MRLGAESSSGPWRWQQEAVAACGVCCEAWRCADPLLQVYPLHSATLFENSTRMVLVAKDSNQTEGTCQWPPPAPPLSHPRSNRCGQLLTVPLQISAVSCLQKGWAYGLWSQTSWVHTTTPLPTNFVTLGTLPTLIEAGIPSSVQ